ncbi:MAG TPA: hypothetical protein VF462_12015 [Micromonosporaceae bacterium]
MDAAELRGAYDVLLSEAEAGGFGPPPEGEWTADQVMAHIAANDELLIETTEAVIAGSPYVCYDHNSIHRPQLDALVAECGGMAELVARVRDSSARVCDVVGRLGGRSATAVDTNIRDGDEIVVNEPLPWGRTIDIHGRVHLPRHTAQLRALRPAGAAPSG